MGIEHGGGRGTCRFPVEEGSDEGASENRGFPRSEIAQRLPTRTSTPPSFYLGLAQCRRSDLPLVLLGARSVQALLNFTITRKSLREAKCPEFVEGHGISI